LVNNVVLLAARLCSTSRPNGIRAKARDGIAFGR